jgi:hypothetical protein
MRMNWEGKAGALVDALDQPVDGIGRERTAGARSGHPRLL